MKIQIKSNKIPIIGLLALASLFPISMSAQNTDTVKCSDETGQQGGFFFTHFNSKNDESACMTLGEGGNYAYSWQDADVMVGGKGWNPGNPNRIVGYNAGDFTTNSGNSYLALYGWAGTGDSLVEYYVVDSWGENFRPPGNSEQAACTVVTDGGTYEIYRTQQVNLPSIESDSDTFFQYWSVRTEPRAPGDNIITFKNHVDAWASQGWNLGAHNYQVMAVEGNFGSGSANVTTWEAGPDDATEDRGGTCP